MRNEIVKIIGRFSDRAFRILVIEALLFSAVFGLAHNSGVVFAVMLLALWGLLVFPKGKLIAMVTLSFLWGIIAASIGHSAGGWLWALGCGSWVFLVGVLMHMKELGLLVGRCLDVPVAIGLNHRWIRPDLN